MPCKTLAPRLSQAKPLADQFARQEGRRRPGWAPASSCSRAATFGRLADDARLLRGAFADDVADHDQAGIDADAHREVERAQRRR